MSLISFNSFLTIHHPPLQIFNFILRWKLTEHKYHVKLTCVLFMWLPMFRLIISPAFHCGGNARGNARVIKRTRPVPDSCVSMEAFSARVSAPVFDDLCVHLDLPRVYKCEMVSFQLMLTKNRARFTFTSGNSDIVSKFFSACGNARVETLQWKRFYVFLC